MAFFGKTKKCVTLCWRKGFFFNCGLGIGSDVFAGKIYGSWKLGALLKLFQEDEIRKCCVELDLLFCD